MKLYLNNSSGQKLFKKHLGNANHLIVTILVGLNAIEEREIKHAPPEMRTVWNPKNSKNSARRARRLALDTVFVRSVDALDIYIRSANKTPKIMQCEELRSKIDGAGRSVFKKIEILKDHFGDRDQLLFHMALVMVAWRNKSAHAESDIEISMQTRLCIQQNEGRICSEFSGLSATEFLAGFDKSEPRLKEVTSLIRVTHALVLLLEDALLSSLNSEQYLKELIWHGQSGVHTGATSKEKKRLIQSVWGKDPSHREDAVLRRLQQQGLSHISKESTSKPFDEQLIDRVRSMTPSDVYAWINSKMD